MRKKEMVHKQWYAVIASSEIWVIEFDKMGRDGSIELFRHGTPEDGYVGESKGILSKPVKILRIATEEEIRKCFPNIIIEKENYEIY